MRKITPEPIGLKMGIMEFIGLSHSDKNQHYIKCKCDCGTEKVVMWSNFKRGRIKSCGCRQRIKRVKYTDHPLYGVWINMRTRCNTPTTPHYKYYGGKGIRVCERWDNYENFYEDVIEGYAPGLQLDRRDGEGDYCPENTRWLTPQENGRNRTNLKLDMQKAKAIRKSTEPARELAKKYNVALETIYGVKRQQRWV